MAVLACGPERAYPRRHRRLHEQVAERGLVLSELPPGTPAQRWSFPARNRIMAGLARMTVVVEAADPSGSLITAEFARDLGRAVAAVPGPGHRPDGRRAPTACCATAPCPSPRPRTCSTSCSGSGCARSRAAAAARPARRTRRSAACSTRWRAAAGVDEIVAPHACHGRPRCGPRSGRLEAEGHVVRGALGGWERAAM